MSKRDKHFAKGPRMVPGATQRALTPPNTNSVSPPRALNPGAPGGIMPSNVVASQYGSNGDAIVYEPPNLISDVDIGLNFFSPMQPVWPYGPPNIVQPRNYDYNVGTNLDIAPQRFVLFDRLKLMSKSWGVLRALIETRKDQLLRVPFQFSMVDKRKPNRRLEEIQAFFRKPDGKYRYNQWARMLLDDLFTIDAPTLYTGARDRGGRPLRIRVLDGSKIKPLIDDIGSIPDWPNPAYQQIIKGLPMNNFTERDLLYAPMRPLPESPIWGFSPVEHIYTEITEAIKKTMYQLGFWTEGNLPDMIMSVPKEWNVKQIASFQALFDANLAGRLGQKSKVRFVPDGMKPYDIKNSAGQDVHSERDEMLIRLACFSFSVSPTPFVKNMNRSTAEQASSDAQNEGSSALKAWWKECIMDPLIQESIGFGYDDIEFDWKQESEVDLLKRSQIFMNYAKSGIRKINELRAEIGDEPHPDGDALLIYTNNGVLPLEDAVALGKAQLRKAEADADIAEQNLKNLKSGLVSPPGTPGNSSRVGGDTAGTSAPRNSKQNPGSAAPGSRNVQPNAQRNEGGRPTGQQKTSRQKFAEMSEDDPLYGIHKMLAEAEADDVQD